MKKHFTFAIVAAILALLAFILFAETAQSDVQAEGEVLATSTEAVAVPRFTHQQEVWIHALEWCESRGINTAINQVDKDGTPSYYAFQFKPGTFRWRGETYGVIPKGKTDAEIMELLKQYDLQRSIVEHMVEDPGVRWENEFPDCIRKLGRPPVKGV